MIHRLYRFFFIGVLISTAAFDANAALGLASPFSDHAVLQREMPVPIWGSADAGKEVTVAFRKQTQTVKADKDGKWHLKLDALEAGGPDELSVSCGDEKIAIADVLVGEVWVGSGQSNMAGGAGGYAKRDATLAKLVKAAPCSRRHWLQWQWDTSVTSPPAWNLTSPHSQRPLSIGILSRALPGV